MPDPQERASLTDAQRAAVEARGDTLVSAAAGSGKTRVLTERFVNLVLSGEARVPEILALTFTEKAARHMKEKIVERFRQLGRESERREVEAAYIGTIHSFGARLLRENALEAGVDPNFVGLDEPAAFALQHQAFEQVCRRTDRPEIAALLVDYDFDKLRDLTVSAYGRLRSLGRRPEEAIIPDAPNLGGLIAAAREAVEAAVNLPRSTASLGRILGEVAERAPVLERLSAEDGFDWAAYDELVALRKCITLGVPAAAKDTMRAAQAAVDRLAAGLLAAPERATALAFRDLLSEFHGVYTQLKDENAVSSKPGISRSQNRFLIFHPSSVLRLPILRRDFHRRTERIAFAGRNPTMSLCLSKERKTHKRENSRQIAGGMARLDSPTGSRPQLTHTKLTTAIGGRR